MTFNKAKKNSSNSIPRSFRKHEIISPEDFTDMRRNYRWHNRKFTVKKAKRSSPIIESGQESVDMHKSDHCFFNNVQDTIEIFRGFVLAKSFLFMIIKLLFFQFRIPMNYPRTVIAVLTIALYEAESRVAPTNSGLHNKVCFEIIFKVNISIFKVSPGIAGQVCQYRSKS